MNIGPNLTAWAPRPEQMKACTADACEQGRGQCPCPAACRISEYDVETKHPRLTALIVAIALVAVIAASSRWPWGFA